MEITPAWGTKRLQDCGASWRGTFPQGPFFFTPLRSLCFAVHTAVISERTWRIWIPKLCSPTKERCCTMQKKACSLIAICWELFVVFANFAILVVQPLDAIGIYCTRWSDSSIVGCQKMCLVPGPTGLGPCSQGMLLPSLWSFFIKGGATRRVARRCDILSFTTCYCIRPAPVEMQHF